MFIKNKLTGTNKEFKNYWTRPEVINTSDNRELFPVERIKKASDGLVGNIKRKFARWGNRCHPRRWPVSHKFHGMYQQDDRDRREETQCQKLEWLYLHMIRLRLPGGAMTPEQWVNEHHIAGDPLPGNKVTTGGQTIQLHGIVKRTKPTIQALIPFTLIQLQHVACEQEWVQQASFPFCHSWAGICYADKISQLALPKTKAY